MTTDDGVPADHLPIGVSKAIRGMLKQVPTARFHEIEIRAAKKDGLIYVAEFTSAKGEGRLYITSDGTITRASGICRLPPKIPIDQWPAPVRATAERLANQQELSQAVYIDHDGHPQYQMTFSDGKLLNTLIVNPDGTLVSITSSVGSH